MLTASANMRSHQPCNTVPCTPNHTTLQAMAVTSTQQNLDLDSCGRHRLWREARTMLMPRWKMRMRSQQCAKPEFAKSVLCAAQNRRNSSVSIRSQWISTGLVNCNGNSHKTTLPTILMHGLTAICPTCYLSLKAAAAAAKSFSNACSRLYKVISSRHKLSG